MMTLTDLMSALIPVFIGFFLWFALLFSMKNGSYDTHEFASPLSGALIKPSV